MDIENKARLQKLADDKAAADAGPQKAKFLADPKMMNGFILEHRQAIYV